MARDLSAVTRAWRGLQGTWQLKRKLHSANASEPSGKCIGTATFTSRQPAIFVDDDGKLQMASKEMLYTEKGDFEMTSSDGTVKTGGARFSFSRKYVWRLQDSSPTKPEISVWFTKPGTDDIDYLFHKFLVQDISERTDDAGREVVHVECSGGHLCVEDFYSSNYTFALHKEESENTDKGDVQSWNMLHEVRGPKKDQTIETSFTRQVSNAELI